ncbi:hypothetical protein LTR91_003627 [Friedmanniomyces endolithicus]|uniref:Uncharacterized protein n=1 Tax=Friedmanniomyces endolithicus TaxID=329885 RepID=A0AAN6J009_9PEZI|nr:hypothetical protein LTR82_017686 [Friedmanniomyces endolithicus]KAK0931897.1 hypothetical protein LTR57_000116 [Friedmanniomyces endolithicus]KAK1007017.1 hypothetical protein LTR91_003627 [Friedmanniomyces endolithicus]KAK1013859.1 hypothetical protein LTS01_000387 [Friedmanniomyces endolithicus]KAK1032346.1 hypothetical protein LTS16_017279 [Friedmanniomyces endolithicus]
MASDLGSAIDDSFEPNFIPESVAPSHGLSAYNGPRSGHWSVSSSIGSAIDDRCPTIWGVNTGPRATGPSGTTAVKPIGASLLKRVGRAAVAERAAAEVERGRRFVREADNESQGSSKFDAKKAKESELKGFYVPKVKGALDVKTKKEVRKEVEVQAAKANLPKRQPSKPRSPSPEPSLRSASLRFTAPSADDKKFRVVRVTDTDGQEAFLLLPNLPRASKTPTQASEASQEKSVKWASDPQTHSKAKPESAPPLRNKIAEMAAEALMSGALPASKKQQTRKQNRPAQVTPAYSAEGSARNSDVGFGGLFEGSSHASSTTMSIKSLSEAVRSISQNSKNTVAPSHRDSIGAANKQTYSKRAPDREYQAVNKDWPDARTPSSGGFRVVGEGWVQAPASVEEPKHSRTTLKVPSDAYDSTTRGRNVTVYSESGHSSAKVKVASVAQGQAFPSGFAPSYNIDGNFDFHQKHPDPTVFAGKGWISPHPLSAAASPSTSPPQSHISLPYSTPHGRDVSYDEWRAIQDGQMEHNKRFSRTESAISSSAFAMAASIARGGSGNSAGRGSAAGSQRFREGGWEGGQGVPRAGQRAAATRAEVGGGVNAAYGSGDLGGVAGGGGPAYRRGLERIVSEAHGGRPAHAPGGHLAMPWDGVESGGRAGVDLSARFNRSFPHLYEAGTPARGGQRGVDQANFDPMNW